jgi:CRISPR-associated endonuclease Csn1
MGKILGLDLGTNSVGWAIRNTGIRQGSQIEDKGVIVFKKGVGDGKSGEFSLAAERRSHRGKRRLYNAKRYRKWELLKVLIENKMCPLNLKDLRLWSIGEWIETNGKIRNIGRKYPQIPEFISWLKMDFNKDGKADFRNPYELRCDLIENVDETDSSRLLKIGRALYHLVQRRGFKSNRKNGKSAYGENEYFIKFKEKHPDKKDWPASKIWLYLLSQNDEDEKLRINRIRNSGVIQRDIYENEFNSICKNQNIIGELKEKLYKAIYYVRPLRSQKGLVGKCTLESPQFEFANNQKVYFKAGKPRIPISHPMFEEFRALQFINNIKWRETDSNNNFEPIPLDLKRGIFEKLFFKKRNYFKFEEIVEEFSNEKKYEFNYAKYKSEESKGLKSNPSIPACPIISGLMNVFTQEWENRFINSKDEFGINWNGLKVEYQTKQYNKEKKVSLDYEGLWHLLFDYLQTNDNEEGLIKFAKEKFGWDEDRANKFANIDIQQGYGALSKNAISKIIPYLQKGYLYSESVFFGNLEKVFGKEQFYNFKEIIIESIKDEIEKINDAKEKLNIVNSIIQEHFSKNNDTIEKIDESYFTMMNGFDECEYIEDKLEKFFSKKIWLTKSEEQKIEYRNFVSDKCYNFKEGKQLDEEKASFKPDKKIKYDYYKLPRLDLAIKSMLKEKFNLEDSQLKYLYHPSDINIYPSFEDKLGDPMPPSKGWKNPMAMRTMQELKKLVNYLLEIDKIDRDTKVVVELPRELNDSNYRKAYTDWINDRQEENKEFIKAISDMFKINNPSDDDFNKFKCAVEQLNKLEFSDNKSEEFKLKYEDFIKTYLKSSNNDTSENFDYQMYLILNRDNFAKMLNYLPSGTKKWVTQIINTPKRFRENRKALKEMLTRYRLWKEQKFQCLYTGRVIPFTELFDASKYQLEHTIPRSISFDSELKNLTVCDAFYNNNVKNNKFPTECPNYENSSISQTTVGNVNCTPIKERIERLIKPNVDELEKRISNLKSKIKDIPDWKKDEKDANIRLRHYLQFELEYWEKKLFTFTVKEEEWKNKFKNSQLIDTQIISKYARAYLKSLFKRVDVQKGTVTAIYREIFRLPPKTKLRENHCHHAIDAAVLTLIPGSATRENEMKEYFEWKEQKAQNYKRPIPYDDFEIHHIKEDIENSIIINHVSKDKALIPTKKYSRKKGKIEYIEDKEGNKTPKIIQGDSKRGKLHKESYFGAIKVVERNSEGFPIKDDEGKYFIKQKNEQEEIWIVARKPITDIDINKDIIVDELLKLFIEKQLNNGKKLNELIDFNGKEIRHIRCRVKAGRGFLSKEKAIELKRHSHISKYAHKQFVLVQSGENYLYLIYEINDTKNKRCERNARILNLFDFDSYGFSSIKEIWNDKYINTFNEKNRIFPLKRILKVDQKVIFYIKNKEELKNLDIKNLSKRLFVVYKFNEMGTPNIFLQNHLESRSDNELDDGDTSFNENKYQYRLKLKVDKLNCIIEEDDFIMKPDGNIIFKF